MEIYSKSEILKAVYPQKNEKNQESLNNSFGTILDDTIARMSKTDKGIRKSPMIDYLSGIPSIHLFP